MSEFDLIATYFTWDAPPRKTTKKVSQQSSQNAIQNSDQSSSIIKNIGDDAAVLSLAPNRQLVTSIDTLVCGVHFPQETSPFDIGHKTLAVNLSDLAAMGAKPEWFTLALTLPEIDPDWLAAFSRGLKNLADDASIALIGGDTTSGPLSISIQVMGSVETDKALYRSGAKAGDKIYLTGTLGDGAAGLLSLRNQLALNQEAANFTQQRLNRPTPRLKESDLFKDFASACIDVSDGLLQDLSHIIDQSSNTGSNKQLGAIIDVSQLPLSDVLKNINHQQAIKLALTGGDDYELLFTVPSTKEAQFLETCQASIAELSDIAAFTCIGTISAETGIFDTNNKPLSATGYNHFA